jgi:hypothetical protein
LVCFVACFLFFVFKQERLFLGVGRVLALGLANFEKRDGIKITLVFKQSCGKFKSYIDRKSQREKAQIQPSQYHRIYGGNAWISLIIFFGAANTTRHTALWRSGNGNWALNFERTKR